MSDKKLGESIKKLYTWKDSKSDISLGSVEITEGVDDFRIDATIFAGKKPVGSYRARAMKPGFVDEGTLFLHLSELPAEYQGQGVMSRNLLELAPGFKKLGYTRVQMSATGPVGEAFIKKNGWKHIQDDRWEYPL